MTSFAPTTFGMILSLIKRLHSNSRNRGRFPGEAVAPKMLARLTAGISLPDAASLEVFSPA